MSTHALPAEMPRPEHRERTALRAIKSRALAEDVAFRLHCMTGDQTRVVVRSTCYGKHHVERFNGSRWVKG